MKIKVSKVFAGFINETATKLGISASAEVVTMPERQYNFFVGRDPYDLDYSFKSGLYKAIKITFPSDFYACPVYLSTAQLCDDWRRVNGRTVADLETLIQDYINI